MTDMADETPTDDAPANDALNGAAEPATKPAEQQMPQMQVLGQFTRDMSFENLSAQKGKVMKGQPDIKVQVGLDARKREPEGRYEIGVKLNVTATEKENAEETIFAMELDYAGIFAVSNVPEKQLHPYIMIECPRMLFPYIRRIVSDVTRDGGFPPLNLENIDFVSLYRQDMMRRAQAQKEASGTAVS
jgi:preprotein translocase subunit SecB